MHVVVVAYGPRAVTRGAVGRVRQWGSLVSAISVVPASPVSSIAPGTFDRVRISTVAGTAGVREVAGDEPALVIHDDVGLGAGGAEELIAALSTSEFAIAAPGGASLGFACFAANSLADVDAPIVIPGASPAFRSDAVSLIDLNPDHGESCRAQLVEDRIDPAEPLLVASMIVKDEEERLPAALASLTGLVDRIDVCDTGSTDATVDVIRRSGGRVRTIEWRNDFALARNAALAMCRDATFALILDADERVEIADPSLFRRWLRTWSHELDAVAIRLENEREHGLQSVIHPVRITRPAVSRFEGAIHEVVTFDRHDGQSARIVTAPGMSLRHIGYRDEIMESRNKHRRNIDIARAAHDAHPSAKAAIDLARSLLAADQRSTEATKLLETASTRFDSATAPADRSLVLGLSAQQEYRMGNLERACTLAEQALEYVPNEDVALITAATALLELGRPTELIALAEHVARRSGVDPLFASPRNVARYRTMVALAHVQVGQFDGGLDRLAEAMLEDAAGVADIVADAVPLLVAAGIDPTRFSPLVAHDLTGQVTRALATQIPPASLSSMCLAGLMLGPAPVPVVSIQLTAALVAGLDDLAAAGLEYADVLDHETRSKLADLASRKGRYDIASRLVAPVATMI